MKEHIGNLEASQLLEWRTFVHFMRGFGKPQDSPVRFPWYALEHSLDVVDKRRAESQNMESLQSRLRVKKQFCRLQAIQNIRIEKTRDLHVELLS